MKLFILSLLGIVMLTCTLQACVEYDPSTGTYTVDIYGCVE